MFISQRKRQDKKKVYLHEFNSMMFHREDYQLHLKMTRKEEEEKLNLKMKGRFTLRTFCKYSQ